MKRSLINQVIREAEQYFAQNQFSLPNFSTWNPADWSMRDPQDFDPILRRKLGWDVTDFGFGDYANRGLCLFTIRNGLPGSVNCPYGISYAEKIMYVMEGQVTPLHFHWQKTEDIINRVGSLLVMNVFPSGPGGEVAQGDVEVLVDGTARTLKAGTRLVLGAGSSITFPPRVYHTFWAEGGPALIGEVSSINDDDTDNRFESPLGRFPSIEEDEPPTRLLVGDYASVREETP